MFIIHNCPPEMAEKIKQEVMQKDLAISVNLIPKVKRTYKEGNNFVVREGTMLLIQISEEKFEEVDAFLPEIYSVNIPDIVFYEEEVIYEEWDGEQLEKKRLESYEARKALAKEKLES